MVYSRELFSFLAGDIVRQNLCSHFFVFIEVGMCQLFFGKFNNSFLLTVNDFGRQDAILGCSPSKFFFFFLFLSFFFVHFFGWLVGLLAVFMCQVQQHSGADFKDY